MSNKILRNRKISSNIQIKKRDLVSVIFKNKFGLTEIII